MLMAAIAEDSATATRPVLVLAGERYTVGWVLEEQAPDAQAQVDPDELRARFPVATRAITDCFAGTGRTADDLFRDGARLVLHLRDAIE